VGGSKVVQEILESSGDLTTFLRVAKERARLCERSDGIKTPDGERMPILYPIPGDTEEAKLKWLSQTFKNINKGTYAKATLPQEVVITLPKKHNCFGDGVSEVIDTRGRAFDGQYREDLEELLRDKFTICVVCTKWPDAPGQDMLNITTNFKKGELQTVEKFEGAAARAAMRAKLCLLVLPRMQEHCSEEEEYARQNDLPVESPPTADWLRETVYRHKRDKMCESRVSRALLHGIVFCFFNSKIFKIKWTYNLDGLATTDPVLQMAQEDLKRVVEAAQNNHQVKLYAKCSAIKTFLADVPTEVMRGVEARCEHLRNVLKTDAASTTFAEHSGTVILRCFRAAVDKYRKPGWPQRLKAALKNNGTHECCNLFGHFREAVRIVIADRVENAKADLAGKICCEAFKKSLSEKGHGDCRHLVSVQEEVVCNQVFDAVSEHFAGLDLFGDNSITQRCLNLVRPVLTPQFFNGPIKDIKGNGFVDKVIEALMVAIIPVKDEISRVVDRALTKEWNTARESAQKMVMSTPMLGPFRANNKPASTTTDQAPATAHSSASPYPGS